MFDRSDLEHPTVRMLSVRHRHAVTDHVCSDCQRPIPTGLAYVVFAYVLDGTFHVDKRHGACV